MNPIPTPRTDEFYDGELGKCPAAEHARKLERENHLLREVMNKAIEFTDGFPAHLSDCTCEYCALAKAIKDYHINIHL